MQSYTPHGGTGRQRIASAIAVGLLHVAVIAALINAFGISVLPGRADPLISVFEARPAPEPSPDPPTPAPRHDQGGRAPLPPARKNEAAPALSPSLAVVPPSPVPPAPRPSASLAPLSGASAAGSGAGGGGSGSGSAGVGYGNGGTISVQIAGEIRESDYPRDAARRRLSGRVFVRYTVGTNGRVTDCAVTRSSGVPSFDEATCRLIMQRFRYEPARDAAGRPRTEVYEGGHTWRMAGSPLDYGEEPEDE